MNVTETQRLILRELGPEDAAFMLELLNTPSWKRFIGDRGVNDLEKSIDFITTRMMKSYAELGFGFYLVLLKEGNVPAGICGMIKRDALDDVDLGFAFLPQYENQGYGTESSLAILEYAKNVHALKRIAAITNPDNERSIALLHKLGFAFQKQILLPGETKEIMLFRKEF
jgi:RimJ/RimL family protein N-acetyltransferase